MTLQRMARHGDIRKTAGNMHPQIADEMRVLSALRAIPTAAAEPIRAAEGGGAHAQ
jgi:hypothetical protein